MASTGNDTHGRNSGSVFDHFENFQRRFLPRRRSQDLYKLSCDDSAVYYLGAQLTPGSSYL